MSFLKIVGRDWHRKLVWIFDFDGTLVDSMGSFADLAGRVLHRHHDTPVNIAREQYRQTSGLPFVAQVERLHPDDQRNVEAVAAFETAKAEQYLNHPPFPEVRETLASLRQRGCTVAISSNNFRSLVEHYTERHGLPVDWICGWEPGFAKGEAHFRYIAERTHRNCADTIFVGDSLKDAAEAQSYGIDFVARSGTFAADEFHTAFPSIPVVASLRELL